MTITAVDVLTKFWPFGSSTLFFCRVVKSSPCFAVYLSSITIVVIALDRYRFVVHSNLTQLSTKQVSLLVQSASEAILFQVGRVSMYQFLRKDTVRGWSFLFPDMTHSKREMRTLQNLCQRG